jgi:RNA polymerase sigma factor (sigma-70 family)
MNSDDLERLHVGVIAQDPVALIDFEAALRPIVLGLVRHKGLSYEDADEVWNDAFLAAINRARTLTPLGAGLRAFTLHVAHMRAVDRIRVSTRRPATVPIDEQFPQPARSLEASDVELRTPLDDCLDQLPPDQRAVLEMTSRGLTASEIAEIIGKGEEAVAKARQRSRVRVAQCLEEKTNG